jgi:two-component system, chemotaxis family, protein-glutamate methylesterase/glutaminase
MSELDVVAVGASIGGLRALRTLVAGFPADFPAAVFVVLHLEPGRASVLAEILSQSGPLPATEPEADGERIRPGRIYVAAPGRHLLVTVDRVRSDDGAKTGLHRPSVDALFASAAAAHGARVIAVVLTGSLSDGTAGLGEVKRLGGTTIAQDPEEAEAPDMPRSAVAAGVVDHRVPLRDIAPLIGRLIAAKLSQ